jgi:pyruvate formate lyase activating enzyme
MLKLSQKLDDRVECLLCPHHCRLAPGQSGICGARKNTGSDIELITYGTISGYALDPVEKKPLYHWFPGYKILSFGSYGCNMRCDFCQNYSISQCIPVDAGNRMKPAAIVRDALRVENNAGVAFTYNEPVISFEFVRDTAIAAKNSGLSTAMISNGFVNAGPMNEFLKFIDAFNIDLKAFNDEFYKKLTGAEVETVKDNLKRIVKAGNHLEITTLIIPGQNDSCDEMEMEAEWIAGELGSNVPLHLSRYFPMYRRNDDITPESSLIRLSETARKKLNFVYVGNLRSDEGQNTICPGCSSVVTVRTGYNIRLLNINSEGRCEKCGTLIFRNLIPSLQSGR